MTASRVLLAVKRQETRPKSKEGSMLICLLLTASLFTVSVTEAQERRLYRVGLVSPGSSVTAEISGLRHGLERFGYHEGRNLLLEIGIAPTSEGLRPVVQSYVARQFDVIVTTGASAPLIARDSTQEIPIVFIGGADPIKAGLVKSMAHPEANITGIARYRDVEIYGKRLEVFKEVVPQLRKVTVLYNARGENPTHFASLRLIQKLAPKLHLTLTERPIKAVGELNQMLSTLFDDSTDGLFPICASIFRDFNRSIAAVSLKKRIALVGCSPLAVSEFGALVYYGANTYRLGQRGAWYVDRLLKGSKPKELPVEAPNYFETVINLVTAKQIGLAIPPAALARADRVIR